MPYIKEEARFYLDNTISILANLISEDRDLSDEEFVSIVGELNYSISRLLAKVMNKPSYSKIAMITGVLENVKQEFYRRIASPYEDAKMSANGDLPEYKKYE